jgi:L-rhamnono-1,4-lactonase
MTLFKEGDVQENASFIKWREAIYTLSRCSKTYMKLSGCFSEIPDNSDLDKEELFEAIMPWLIVVLAAFHPFRMMFGSDWPVCTIGGGADGWKKWTWIVRRLCELGGLGLEEQVMLWSGTAIKAYQIRELM